MRYIYGYRNFRTEIIVTICLMTIAFATVSTTLIIKGAANFEGQDEEVKVYFSDAKVVKPSVDDSDDDFSDGNNDDYSDDTKDDYIIKTDNHIAFSTVIRSPKDVYNLDYDVTNDSNNKDVAVDVMCKSESPYIIIMNIFDARTELLASETRKGRLSVILSSDYNGGPFETTVQCMIRHLD